jgi:NADH-dependent fumarate reductase subunit C
VTPGATNQPLTAKEFDEERTGVCFGCGCYCGYIAYLKEGQLVDVYGHPNDPNGMGSLCSKGIALLQDLHTSPFRVRKVLLREGETFREGSLEEVRERVGGRVGIFLDRVTADLRDHLTALRVTDRVYSDALHLPFRPSTLKPQEWVDRRLILAVECDPVFSEVMASRWIVDAVEKGSYLVYVGSRYGTVAQKAEEVLITKPPKVVKFLENLAETLEGRSAEGGPVRKVADLMLALGRPLILLGDLLLRTEWRGNVLRSLTSIRRRTGADYCLLGDLSPLPVKGVEDLLKDLPNLDTLITTGNPFRYLPEDAEENLRDVFKIHLSLVPNLTANLSDAVIPALSFQERPFVGYRNGFFSKRSSGAVVRSRGYTLSEILGILFGVEVYDLTVPELPPLDHADLNPDPQKVEEEGIYLVADRTLVEDLGHWSLWTHEMEGPQEVRMNRRTADTLGVKDRINLGSAELKVRIDSNVADDTLFLPDSYEETQPFDPGVRVGRILPRPGLRVFRYR